LHDISSQVKPFLRTKYVAGR